MNYHFVVFQSFAEIHQSFHSFIGFNASDLRNVLSKPPIIPINTRISYQVKST